MSKVPYTVNVDRYICSELEDIRTMTKHLDFSRLPATIERIQFHASAMEDGLWAQKDLISEIRKVTENEGINEKAKVDDITALIAKYDKARK